MSTKIVEMSAGCIAALAEIEAECFESPWSKNGLEAELHEKTARFYVCVQGDAAGVVIGYIGAHIAADECYIANLAVRECWRKKGVASALLRRLTEQARCESCRFVSLEVRKSNLAAMRLYEKNGFVKEGERRGFYTDPKEDAEIYTKRLV